jgi:uncharacterized protein YndB with AHSA1/START domain
MPRTRITAEPGSPVITLSRVFDAPRELVYRAHVEPDLLVRWLGPRRLTMRIDRYDVRHGGSYRYVHAEADGTEYGFRGVFHGEPSPDGITQTFEFEGYPGHVSLETARFIELDGRTTVEIRSVYQSVEDRDAMIASGMETGIDEGYERLDELLARERTAAPIH